ncbi:flagellar basal body rod protein FlgC (plasmid) [Rossellomorea sp. AcN35-11]|nr:flagellar basal body rod protein FlgC [Rossellomorea aquimaris]WJV32277.1 flagellar basal body rod protein FlgC [Rossellomorea sp. AcN35-11]
MAFFSGMNTSASALTAQRLRMDVVSSNIANSNSTRASLEDGEWQPYRRKMVTMQQQTNKFDSYLDKAMGKGSGQGVQVNRIKEDQTPFKMVFNPQHPDANEEGYVEMPNVDPLKEMVDLMSATRSYEANITAFNANKGMMMKALELGR